MIDRIRLSASHPVSSLVLVVAAISLCPPALAQSTDGDEIEEVIITAQRREQSAMRVPVTVNVFGAADIEKTGALTMFDMQDFVPGFEVGKNPTQAGISIRGVSSPNITTGGDPSVATFYDDIYVPRAATQMTFGDMARVEILKGPQGTLYGRNAAAGVVNMVPNAPAPEDEGFVRARFGNHSLRRIEAMGNIALTDSFFLRANFLTNKRDGYVNNLVPDTRDPGSEDNVAFRLAGLWRISDAARIQLSFDQDRLDNAPRPAIGISQWSACPGDPFCGQVSNDVIDGSEGRDMQAIALKAFYDFSDQWSGKLLAGYRQYDVVNRQDEDGTAEIDRYLDTDNIEDSDILYNEIQLNFSGERVNAVFGANISEETTHQVIPVNLVADSAMRAVTAGIAEDTGAPLDHIWDPNQMAFLMQALTMDPTITPDLVAATGDLFYDLLDGFLPGVPVVGPSFAGQPWSEIIYNDGKFTNWGVYGDVEYAFDDRWTVLFGLRYSNDKKRFSWRNPPNTLNDSRPGTDDLVFVVVPGYEQARSDTLTARESWDKVTGRAVVNYRFSDEAMAFLSYSTGYKAGGFDSLDFTSSDNPLRPEESENLELGLKGDFFSGTLRTELSVFDMSIDGRQRTVDTMPPGQPNAIPRVINGDQQFTGVEVVLNWSPVDDVSVGFLTTWRDVDSTWEPFYNAVGEFVTETSSSSADTDYTITADWTPGLANGSLAMRIEYIFNENNAEDDPDVINPTIPGFGDDRELLNARVAWMSDDDNWTVALWGKNLLDNEVVSGVNDITTGTFGTTHVTIYPPQTYGVEVGVSF